MFRIRSKILLLTGAFCSLSFVVNGFPPQKNTRQQYIDQFAKIAMQEMMEYHIPASITMAQACLESSDGNSTLATEANNHFGIKCKSNWNGPTIRKDDDAHDECFRKYRNAQESYRDHSEFLTGGMRYQFLFDYNIKDYKKWAYGLKRAGYATDPTYPERLLKIIEEFQLYKLDDLASNSSGIIEPEVGPKSIFSKHEKHGQNLLSDPYITRDVKKRNGKNAFFSKEGDTYERLAAEFSMKESTICWYNDVGKGESLEPGTVVFLQRKRGRAPQGNTVHTMRVGESLWSVAQWYGIRLNALCRKNRIKRNETLVPGQQISLRYRVSGE